MKTQLKLVALTLLALSTPKLQLSTAFAQGTAFTYQGQLQNNGVPASGLYDLRFRLFVDPLGNNQAGNALLTNGVPVTNGLFAVSLDFGAGIFNGSNYWLEVDVKTNGGAAYTDLSPLQALTPAPYAVFANTASNLIGTLPAAQLSGTVPPASLAGVYGNVVTLSNANNNFTGSFSGNGAGVTNVNAASLNGFAASNFWQITGNGGTTPGTNFVGTTDFQPLELHVSGMRALRIEPNTNGAPNMIGGAPFNYVSNGVSGATISGGGGLYGSPYTNRVLGNFGTVGGGEGNTASGYSGTVGGGFDNTSGYSAIVGGGVGNTASGVTAAIGGGNLNIGSGGYTFIGGGVNNSASAYYATVSGGQYNYASGTAASVGGGQSNSASANFSFVGGGGGNTNAEFYSAIAGGQMNLIQPLADHSFIGGGQNNTIAGTFGPGYAVIGGGQGNVIQTNSSYGVIGGGFGNTVQSNSYFAVVPGGSGNLAGGTNSFAVGASAQATNNGAFVWSDMSSTNAFNSTASNQFSVRALGGVVFVTGGAGISLDGQPVLTSAPSGNFVSAFTTTIQAVGTPNAFQDVLFNTDAQINGWTHTAGTSQYTNAQTGLYLIQYNAQVGTTGVGTNAQARATLNSTEISGSRSLVTLSAINQIAPLSRNLIASANAGDVLTIQYTGSGTGIRLAGAPGITLTIVRIQ